MKPNNNPLKDLMIASGYNDFSETNRSYYTKCINNILKDGRVTLKICEPGRVWRNKDNTKKWNIIVRGAGWENKIYSSNVNGFSILRAIGSLLEQPEVREKILAEVRLHTHCERCNGRGIIPQFSYYCNGICFECYGLGFSKQRDSVHIVPAAELTNNQTLNP